MRWQAQPRGCQQLAGLADTAAAAVARFSAQSAAAQHLHFEPSACGCDADAAVLLFTHSATSSSSAVPWTVVRQAPLCTFPRQEYRTGLPLSSLGDLSNPGIKPKSPALTSGSLTTEPPGKLTAGSTVLLKALHCKSKHALFSCSFFYICVKRIIDPLQTTTQLHSSHTLVK